MDYFNTDKDVKIIQVVEVHDDNDDLEDSVGKYSDDNEYEEISDIGKDNEYIIEEVSMG